MNRFVIFGGWLKEPSFFASQGLSEDVGTAGKDADDRKVAPWQTW